MSSWKSIQGRGSWALPIPSSPGRVPAALGAGPAAAAGSWLDVGTTARSSLWRGRNASDACQQAQLDRRHNFLIAMLILIRRSESIDELSVYARRTHSHVTKPSELC